MWEMQGGTCDDKGNEEQRSGEGLGGPRGSEGAGEERNKSSVHDALKKREATRRIKEADAVGTGWQQMQAKCGWKRNKAGRKRSWLKREKRAEGAKTRGKERKSQGV
jgi:hypothetical protein